MIPYINHNQAPRNVYQISMGKQALGMNMHRGATKELIFSSDPILKCSMQDSTGLNKRGAGQMVQVALMSRPNTSEDAVVVKREFLERGGLMMLVRYKYKTSFRDVSEPSETLIRPNVHYSTIEPNGLPRIGAAIVQSQCVIGKLSDGRDDSVKMYCGEEAVVHDVTVTSINKTTHVIVDLRIVRNQIEGDKVSPRNAQKCTMGEVTREYSLPRVLNQGWSPDIYVNTHCIPGRVTISYQLMMSANSIGARLGKMFSGDPSSFSEVVEHLNSKGQTKYYMSKGLYGAIKNQISSSPVYFQALRHQVLSKKMCRGYGKVNPFTRAPIRGKCWNGGLKFTEMESDAVHTNGACAIVRNRLMDMADKYKAIFCKVCGHMTEFDTSGPLPCVMCNSQELVKSTVTYISQVITHILNCAWLKMERVFDCQLECPDSRFQQYLKGSRDPNVANYTFIEFWKVPSSLGLPASVTNHAPLN